MAASIQNIKGMPDILPAQTGLWQFVEKTIKELLVSYGYTEIRMPIVEYTDLFKRTIGEVTDIVEKEMYTFPDRHNDLLTLRPEGTASCVRACLQNGLLANEAQQRLWYAGPMFRYENPQKGRQRQFHQFGVETFGIATADIDSELILMAYRLWQKLKIDHLMSLQINTIGTTSSREAYKNALVNYLQEYKDQLDADSQRRLETNPLRILDSKSVNTQALLNDAPKLHDYLDEESKQHFNSLCFFLDQLNIPYTINQHLVRGLDYYNKTVFEWVTNALGAQGTVCAGGRYDSLVEQLGGKPVPASGFAIGLERLCLLLQATEQKIVDENQLDIYFVIAGDDKLYAQALKIAEQIRSYVPQLKMLVSSGGNSFKSQMKKADKSGASYAFIFGSNELEAQTVILKPLRQDFDAMQEIIGWANLPARIQSLVKG
jgi:histidyl-tRNA synthetase